MQTHIMTLTSMANLADTSRWSLTWEDGEEFSEWIVQQCAYIFRLRNPYQFGNERAGSGYSESWKFKSNLIGSTKHPDWPIEEHEYFLTIENTFEDWNHKVKGKVSHLLIYGHEWEDLMNLMTMNGFVLNSITSWNHNSKRDSNDNMVIEPKLEITFVQRNLNREVIE